MKRLYILASLFSASSVAAERTAEVPRAIPSSSQRRRPLPQRISRRMPHSFG